MRTRALLFLLVVVSVFVPHPLPAQGRILTLVFESEPSRKVLIGGMRHNGVAYASLNDIAQALSLRAAANRAENSFSITAQNRPVTFFADNPFVVTTNQAGSKVTLQLPMNIRASPDTYYVPIAACVPHFIQLFGFMAAYDASSSVLRIGRPGAARSAFDISSLTLDPKANGMMIRVSSGKPLELFEGLLHKDGWFYLSILNAKADIAALNKTKPAGAVTKIVATQFHSSVQIAFRLDGQFSSSNVVKDETSNDLLLTLRSLSDETVAAIEEKRKPTVITELERHRKKYELDVIVLDAGHGGKDPGAIGVMGTKEKDITLAIVLKLGRLIAANLKGVKVEYTRQDDIFVELDKRGRIANEKGGKLFISVHCNSMPRKPYPRRGFEVYLLRPGRTDEAIAIAERENSVIQLEEGYEERYKHLTDDNFILVTMAQSAHMRASEMFADIATQEMDKLLDIPNHGVKQAGFYVLVGSAMPNVLVETAFLSNREDEKLLRSKSGQEKIAEALFNGIKRYKSEYEKLLQEGKELGEK